MAFWSRKPKEERDYTGFLKWEDVFSNTPNTPAGVQVDRVSAFGLPVVYRCVSLNAMTIAALPVDAVQKVGETRREIPGPDWLENPNREYDWMQFIQEVQTSLEIDGNAFIQCFPDKLRASVLLHLAPHMVRVDKRDGELIYTLEGAAEPIPAEQMLHIKAYTHPRTLRGLSPIQMCMTTVGLGLAAQEFGARFFGDGAHMSGVIEIPGNPDDQALKVMKESFAKSHTGLSKSHAIGALTGGAKFTAMSISPEEAQFIETRMRNAEEISWMFGIPPQYTIGAEGAKGYVTGITAGKMMWLQAGLLYRIVRLEKSLSSLLPKDQGIKFNLRGFLRPDPTEQASLMVAEVQNGVRTRNEWRSLLDLNPLPGGDKPLIPLNMGGVAEE
jgi:HK97 family phage portal protein